MKEEEYKELEKIINGIEDIDQEFSLQGLFTCQYLKKIIQLLKQKVCIETQNFPQIIERLDTLIEQLNTKILLETPQPPTVECECTVAGTATFQPNPGQTGTLAISVCEDCTIENSTFTYQVLNPAGVSLQLVTNPIFNSVDCTDLNEELTGTVVMTGTALVQTGAGVPQSREFTLTLEFINGDLVEFTIEAGPAINETVDTFLTNDITVTECPPPNGG